MSSFQVESFTNRALGSTFIELDDVRVPVDHLIGEENKGFPLIMSSKSASPPIVKNRLTMHSRLQPRASLTCLCIPATRSRLRRRRFQLRHTTGDIRIPLDPETSHPSKDLQIRIDD